MIVDISSDYRCFKWLVQLAYRIGLSVCFFYLIYAILFSGSKRLSDENAAELMEKYGSEGYLDSCQACYQKMSLLSDVNFDAPPPQKPAAELVDEFQASGDMPITRYVYKDDATAHAQSRSDLTISKEMLKSTALKLKDASYLGEAPFEMKNLMLKYESVIENSHALVIGSDTQWVEAFLLHFLGMKRISTLEYEQRQFEDERHLNWFQIKAFLESALESRKSNTFDIAISHSFVQHLGLGE